MIIILRVTSLSEGGLDDRRATTMFRRGTLTEEIAIFLLNEGVMKEWMCNYAATVWGKYGQHNESCRPDNLIGCRAKGEMNMHASQK